MTTGGLFCVAHSAHSATGNHPLLPESQYPFSGVSDVMRPTVAVADLDGDGYVDLAKVATSDDSVEVSFSNESGGFFPPVIVPTLPLPRALTVGDIDGDGDADMITAHNDSFGVLLNDGSGTFSAPNETTAHARIVILGPFSSIGGLPDLVTASNSLLQVYTNNGDGTFTFDDQHFISPTTQLIAADIAGDSLADLIRLNNGNISLYINQGNATFDPQPSINPVGDDIHRLAPGDFDGNGGKADLAMLSSNPHLVSISFNDGNGSFGPVTSYPVTGPDGEYPTAIRTAELGASGAVDVVVSFHHPGGEVWVLPNDGSGNLGTEEIYVVATDPREIYAADLDNDNAPDVLVDHGARITILMNADGDDSKLFAFDRFAASEDITGITAADFNMDGYPDLATSMEGTFDGAALFFNNRDGTFAPQVDVSLSSGNYETATAADLNDDGAPDFVTIRGGVPDKVVVLINNGDGSFAPAAQYDIGDTGSLDPRSTPDIADFTDDGHSDIAVTNLSSDTVSVLVNDGTGGFGLEKTSATFNEPSHSAPGDFNSDGFPDLAITTNDVPTEVKLYLNDNTDPSTYGTFLPGPGFAFDDSPASDIEVGDFNADGHPDIALPVFQRHRVWVLLGDGASGFETPVSYPVDERPIDLAIDDLNGDSAPDLLVLNQGLNASAGRNLSVLLNQGDGTFAPAVNYHTGRPDGETYRADSLALANFDRDELDAVDVTLHGRPGFIPSITMFPNVRGVELDEAVFCSHDPLLVQPGDDVEITATVKHIVDGAVSPMTGQPANVEIWVDDTTMPVVEGLANTQTHLLESVPAGSFTYGCRVTDGPVEVFSGWRRVAVGPAPNSQAIPVIYTGDVDERIDIVFFADSDDYTAHDDPDFLTAALEFLENSNGGLWNRLWFVQHQQWFNFWIAPDLADGYFNTLDDRGIIKPENWDTDYGFARARVIIHSEPFRDFAKFGGLTIEAGKWDVLAHELGHREFGLADEYDCPPCGGYYESKKPGTNTPFLPNLHSTLNRCGSDAPFLGRPASDCRMLDHEDMEEWFLSEPDSDDLMKSKGRPRAADLRRMNWLIEQCQAGNC